MVSSPDVGADVATELRRQQAADSTLAVVSATGHRFVAGRYYTQNAILRGPGAQLSWQSVGKVYVKGYRDL